MSLRSRHSDRMFHFLLGFNDHKPDLLKAPAMKNDVKLLNRFSVKADLKTVGSAFRVAARTRTGAPGPHSGPYIWGLLATLLMATTGWGQNKPLTTAELESVKRIYVPEEQLGVVVGKDQYGAILTLEEYEQLIAEAGQRAPVIKGLEDVAIVNGTLYEMSIDGDRLLGTLTVDQYVAGKTWKEGRFDITGWNVESATSNGKPVALARDGESHNVLRVFMREPGQQLLKIGLSAPLLAHGGDKAATVNLVNQAVGEFRITLPAGKYLEAGATALERPTPAEQATTYSLPIGGMQSLSLKITDRQKSSRGDVLTFASSAIGVKVLPSEMTWIAKTEIQVFGREIDRLTCLIPNSLEITSVESNGLESWELADAPNDDTKTLITLLYRQGFDGRRGVTFQGILSATPEEPWSVPTLMIPSVTSHTGSIVIQHPETVRLQAIESVGVRAVDTLGDANQTRSSAESQLNYQIWDENFSLRFVASLKQQSVQAAMTNVLDLTAAGLNLYTTVSVETRLAPLFDFRLRLPAGWEVTTLQINGASTPWQTVSLSEGGDEIRVPLNPPLAPGETRNISLSSRILPESWPVEEATQRVVIPEVRLPQVEILEALYGIASVADFELVTQEMTGLDPAGQMEIELLNQKLQAAGKSIRLAYTYQETEFSGQLDVSRKPATLTGETTTFFRVDPENLFTRLESVLSLTGGGYRQLQVLVSESAGEELRFTMLPEVSLQKQQRQQQAGEPPAIRLVEQLPGEVVDGLRTWTLRFDRFLKGNFRLMTEARTPRAAAGPYLPIEMKFPESELTSGFLAVEGTSEEHVKLTAIDAGGKPLSVVDPVDFPVAHYQPQERVVAGFRYIHPGWKLSIETEKFDRSAVPTVIGHSATLNSVLSQAGEFQHQASIVFTAIGAQSLLVELPRDATLWSTLLDQVPVEIRQSPAGMQIPIAGLGQGQHTLQLSYSTVAPRLNRMGELQTVPPALSVVDGEGEQQSVEILSQDWQLHLPEETLLIASDGLFQPVGRLFESSLFTRLIDLFRLPGPRALVNRSWSIGFAVLAMLILWSLSRANWLTRLRETSSVIAWLSGISVLLVLVVVGLYLSLGSKQELTTTGSRLDFGASDATVDRLVVTSEPMFDSPGYYARSESMVKEIEEFAGRKDLVDEQGLGEIREEGMEQAEKKESERQRGRNLLQRRTTAPGEEQLPPLAARPSLAKEFEQDGGKPEAEAAAAAQPPAPSNEPESQVDRLSETIVGLPIVNGLSESPNVAFRQGKFDGAPPFSGGLDATVGQQNQRSLDGISANGRPVRELSILGRMSTGGLLSMTFDLQIPEGTRAQKFHYQGNGLDESDVNLRVRFANRTTGQILIWSMTLGIALLGWWLRGTSFGIKTIWIGLTVLLPISLAWVVPTLMQLLLEGILYGGIACVLLWSVRWCTLCCKCCCGWFTRQSCPAAFLFLGCLICATSPVSAQPVAVKSVVQQIAPVPAPEKAPFVVVPYSSLAQIDAAERVWIPQKLYRQLWEAAHPEELPTPDGPVAATISEAVYRGTLQQVGTEQQIAVQARWVISVMTEGMVSLAVPMTSGAIASATANGQQAVLEVQQDGSSHIVLKGRGIHVVDAVLSLPANVNGSVGEFSLQTLPVASGIFSFELPKAEGELRVRVDGLERVFRRVTDGETTRIEFPIDRGGKKTLNWYPAADLGGQNQIVQVETAIAASVDDTGLNVSHAFQTRIRQGGLNDMTFTVPATLAVREITGQDIGGWELKEVPLGKDLKIFFRREITDQTEFHVNLHQTLNVGNDGSSLEIPTIAPQGVSRETVQLALYAASHLRMRVVSSSGLSQIDVGRYQPVVTPQQPPGQPLYAYRSASRPLELNVGIERRIAEAKTEVEHGVHIARRKLLIATRIQWQLTGSPRRRVDVAIPDGYLPIGVVCADASDWYVHPGEQGNVLTIEFSTPKLGRIEAGLEGHIVKQPDDSALTMHLPHPLEANGQTATLGIWLDAAYQASLAQTGDWKSLRPEQLSGNYRKLDSRAVQFAFRSDDDNPAPIELNVQTAVPKLTGDGVTLIAVSDATIDYGLTLRWKISQAAADEFIFTTPNWLTNLEINGPTIRQIRSEAVGEDRKRWIVSLVDPVRDQYLLNVAATIPAPLDQQIRTPFVTMETRTATDDYQALPVQQQFAILVNLSPGQLVPVDLEQFESVSVEQLPLNVHQELLQQAMEVTRVRADKLPSWSLQRMEEFSVAKAVVLSTHLETVLELDGSWRTLATYGIRNRGRQFLALTLPEDSRILSVFVRGVPSRTVVTKFKEQTLHLVALPQTSAADLSFDVEVLLAGRFNRTLTAEFALRGRRFAIPSPGVLSQNDSEQFGLPVTQTLWTVHLPPEVDAQAVTGVASTNLTPHQSDAWLAVQKQTLERLKSDVAEMSRIAADQTVSRSRRMQSKYNLKQLGQSLERYEDEYRNNIVNEEEAVELKEQLFNENRFLQGQAEKAIESIIDNVAVVELDAEVPLQQGRAYIQLNNSAILSGNARHDNQQMDKVFTDNGTTTFNFIAIDSKELGKKQDEGVTGKAAATRSKLKSQFEGQGLSILSAADDGANVLNPGLMQSRGSGTIAQQAGSTPTGGVGGGRAGGERFDIAGPGTNGVVDPFRSTSSTEFGTMLYDGAGMGIPPGSGRKVNGLDHRDDNFVQPVPARPWTAAGGLSIAMDLPKNSNTLSFSKVGGNPELLLAVQSVEHNRRLWGLGWCVLSLMGGLWVLKRMRRATSQASLWQFITHVGIVIGLVGFFCLSGDLVWLFFWIFCVAGCLRVVLSRLVVTSPTAA